MPKDHLTLIRNPDSKWEPSFWENRGPAYLDEIIFRFYQDPATRAPAIESGQAQVMGKVPPQDVDRLTASGKFTLVAAPIPGQPLQMFLNTQRAPTDDLRVRQALVHATDRAAIVKAIFRDKSPAAFGPLTAVTIGNDREMSGRTVPYYRTLLNGAVGSCPGWNGLSVAGLKAGDKPLPDSREGMVAGRDYVPGEALVVLRTESDKGQAQALADRHGFGLGDLVPHWRIYRLSVPAGQEQAALDALRADLSVAAASPNWIVRPR